MSKNKDFFKAGFLAGLAEQGMTPSELETEMEKKALPWTLMAALPLTLAGTAIAMGSRGATAAGRGVGRGIQAMGEPTPKDIDILKKEEELGEYQRLTQEARRKANTRLSGL